MDLVVALVDDSAHLRPVVAGEPGERHTLPISDLPDHVRSLPAGTRLVWADTGLLYPHLLRAGVRVNLATDLLMVRRILRAAAAVRESGYGAADEVWDAWTAPHGEGEPGATLFDVAAPSPDLDACVREHLVQQETLRAAGDGGRLALLCHAESTGALIAQELRLVGMPFDTQVHHALLTEALGERDPYGGRPPRMAALVEEIRAILGEPRLNPDSAPTLIAALRRAGLDVTSTRKWELRGLDHPVIEPLLAYKKLSRLHSANGWAWMESWVRDGRFHPDWVAGGVVTGRWASRGGGALQLPHQIRGSVRAPSGWRLVVADAAQLEPRVLAAMSGDRAMAAAGAAGDLYQALVDQGVVDTRAHAKVAMLGAMYGATTGEAGDLMPRLRRAYPRAIGLVDAAAAAGERGEPVSTWLGRTSPVPSARWHAVQAAAQEPGAGQKAERRARQVARDWGRFTRNFVVQGTAAEWALCWMGHLRRRLEAIEPSAVVGERPRLVSFLHDEVVVESPTELADEVAAHVVAAAEEAGRLLFGGFPVAFPLSVSVVEAYDQAKN